MEKQKSMRQVAATGSSQRKLTTTAARRMDSTTSLVAQESRRRLAPTNSTTGLAPEDPLATENELYGNNNPNSNGSSMTTSSFDKLELLGPSLVEVLTLVNPPKPRAQQEQEQLDSQMQQAGEDTEGGDFGFSNNSQQLHTSSSSSNASLSGNNPSSAKFDVCVSRSAVLGKISDASVDNSRKTQEYFAKILDKLKIEATGLVLLQESTIMLFLETTAEQLLVLCRQLLSQKLIESASMRVLASCDDNPERILQGLYFKKVTVNRSAGGGGDNSNNSSEWTDESLTQHAVETFLNLIKFVKKIGPMAPAEIRKCLTNLTNTDQLLLPANDLVLWLLTREELMGLDEFLVVYDRPVAIELESERVWPVHPLIHY